VIITADSAGGMVDIHDRRPVTLSPELAREWLDPATPKERSEQMALLQDQPRRSSGSRLIKPWEMYEIKVRD
jgi:putative SOS response-associated peptidase YedK